MTDDDAFLQKLLLEPNNDLIRLVYADWLDEQQSLDSMAKAEFLRLIADPDRASAEPDRAGELAGQLDAQWLAVVSKLPVENCAMANRGPREILESERELYGFHFNISCPLRWEDLSRSGERTVRYCGECQKSVYYCHDVDDLRVNANLGNCVAVQLGVPRRPGDADPDDLEILTMGLVEFRPDDADARQRATDEVAASSRARRRRRQRQRRTRTEE